jgi:hypothetical protein
MQHMQKTATYSMYILCTACFLKTTNLGVDKARAENFCLSFRIRHGRKKAERSEDVLLFHRLRQTCAYSIGGKGYIYVCMEVISLLIM